MKSRKTQELKQLWLGYVHYWRMIVFLPFKDQRQGRARFCKNKAFLSVERPLNGSGEEIRKYYLNKLDYSSTLYLYTGIE